uniref:C2 domain-containing protein n=1 Tax=Globodera pallida TaxID=36090 RepID=A0A183C470_GLOPA
MSVRRETVTAKTAFAKRVTSSDRSKSFSGPSFSGRSLRRKMIELEDDLVVPGMHPFGQTGGTEWVDSPGPADGFRGEETCSRVLLTITAKDLLDLDPDECIDPFCKVSVCDASSMAPQRQWELLGQTEVVGNTSDPEWSTKICLTFFFEEQQRLLFEVFDKNKEGLNPAGRIYPKRIGQCTMLLHEVVGAHMNRLCNQLLEEGKAVGWLTVTAEELSEGRQESVYFVVSGTNLDKKDLFGKCDPFLKVSRINADSTMQLAYRTRYHEQNLNPKWKPFEILTQQLCYADKDRPFLIECFDWDQDGDHDLVGACQTTVNRLMCGLDKELPVIGGAWECRLMPTFQLVNEKKLKKHKKYVDSGQVHFHRVFLWHDYTFLDFIRGGTEMDFTVAIDFTRSNLPMKDQSSLHRFDTSNRPNQYEIAIGAIAEICQHYSKSKLVSAYGFGARIPALDDKVHYNFPLNLESNDPYCRGVDGLLEAYSIALSHVELSGPTDFTPTIRLAARRAAALPENGSRYCVLLIVTDGAITDFEETKEEIVKASALPLSIIVIGVGYDTFEEMKVLDSDKRLLSSHKKFAKRDIVQFVQMRKFLPPHRSLTDQELATAKAKLAKEVLFEVPAQLIGYMKSKGIYPRPPDDPFTAANQCETLAQRFVKWESGESGGEATAQQRRSSSLKTSKEMLRAMQHKRASASAINCTPRTSPRTPRRILPTPPDEHQQQQQSEEGEGEGEGEGEELADKMRTTRLIG